MCKQSYRFILIMRWGLPSLQECIKMAGSLAVPSYALLNWSLHTLHCESSKWAKTWEQSSNPHTHSWRSTPVCLSQTIQHYMMDLVSIQMWQVWAQLGSKFSGICAVSRTSGGSCNLSYSSIRCTPRQCGRKASFGHSCRWCMLLCRYVSTDPQTEEMNESSWQYIGQHHGHERLQTSPTCCSPTKNRSHKHTTKVVDSKQIDFRTLRQVGRVEGCYRRCSIMQYSINTWDTATHDSET